MVNDKIRITNKLKREIWLNQVISSIPKGHRILDAGAGELQYKKFCNGLDYVSQDFCQYDGCGDSKGLQTGEFKQLGVDLVCDITEIPEPSNSFDAIMCIEVLEHVPNPVLVIQELSRLLKPNGKLILTAPFCSLTHFAPYFFQTGYSKYFYQHWLDYYGLDILSLEHNGNFFEYLAQELQRIPSVSKQYSGKELSFFERIAQRILLKALMRFSRNNNGSEELLSFGVHVLAEKKITT